MTTTENTTFDIIQFIEKNPLKKLNDNYQNIFINKIKNNFNEKEQNLFVTSFYCYLNFNSLTDFIIDFEDVWKWCGFTRKDNAKRLLEKFFTNDVDYKVALLRSEERKNEGGFNKEKITLNINTFKKYCLKSNTKKADEIHNYYIKLEEILQDILLQQTNELKLQLEKTNNELEKSTEENKFLKRKYIKNPKVIFNEKNVVYLMCTTESEKEGEYIVGKASDLSNRKEDYNHNKLHDFKVVYFISCNSLKLMDIVESSVLMKLGKYRSKAGRDVFLLPKSENITLFTDIIDKCLKFYEDVDEECVIYPKRTLEKMDKDEYKKKSEKYRSEHMEEIKEKIKEYYNDNKDILKDIKKVYYEKNTDIIAEKHKKYYDENKDKVIEKCMEYYEENKEQILEDRKNFYENNKEQILKERTDYYKENYKLKIAPQRQKKENCECGMIIAHVSMKNHKKSARHKCLLEQIQISLK